MKEKSLTSMLLALLALLILAAAVLGFAFNRRTSQLRRAQGAIATMQRNNEGIQVLGADVLAYSAKNPAINPIIQSFGLKLVTNTVPATRVP
jgi:hypothetical protein